MLFFVVSYVCKVSSNKWRKVPSQKKSLGGNTKLRWNPDSMMRYNLSSITSQTSCGDDSVTLQLYAGHVGALGQ